MVDTLFESPGGDGAGDLIAGQELVDEPLTVDVADDGAVSPQRLGQQRSRHGRMVQRGGVELHELHVGHGDAGGQRHGEPVPGRLGGVGRDGEELAGATRREQHVGGRDLHRSLHDHAAAAAVADHESVEEARLVHDRRCRPDRFHQRSLDLGAGGRAAGVHDPGMRVAALAGERQPAVGVAVEAGAEGDQLADPVRSFADEDPHGVDVAEPGAGREGVGEMAVDGVLFTADDRGHAALGPAGRRLFELSLGDHAHPQAGGGGPHGGGQAGDTRPAHDEVEVGGGTGHVSMRAWRSAISSVIAVLLASTCTMVGSKPSSSASS